MIVHSGAKIAIEGSLHLGSPLYKGFLILQGVMDRDLKLRMLHHH